MNKRIYRHAWLIALGFLFCSGASFAAGLTSLARTALQDRVVTGNVKSPEGETLPGVNIIIKGTSVGTVTDVDGNYKINVADPEAVLVFSFIGYASEEVPVGSQTSIDVILTPSIETLSEIVVIGYGTVKKSDLTGSVSSVKADELKAVPTTSFDQALQGRAAGVQVVQTSGQPGAEASIRIRGVSSIQAGNEPLYVIDGMLISTNTADMTTGTNQGPRVSPLAAINPSDIESIEILKDASATAIYGSRGTNGVVLITTKRGKSGMSSVNIESYYGVQEVSRKVPLLNAAEFADFVNETEMNAGRVPLYVNPANLGEGTDWQDEIFRVAPIQSYQISVMGGDDKTQYAVSGGYFQQQGIVINTDFERYSFRTNVNRAVSKKINVGTNLSLARTSGTTINTGLQFITPGVIGAALGMNPILPVYDASEEGGYTYENDRGITIGNPVAEAMEHSSLGVSTRILGNIEARYKINDHLEFKSTFGIDGLFSKDNTFAPRWLKASEASLGEATVATLQAMTWLNENTLTYTKDFNEGNNLNAVIGYTLQEFQNERVLNYVFNFPDSRTGYHNLGAGLNPQAPGNNETRWSMISYLGRAQYSLKDRYLFTVTGRVDASSKFAENNKYAFFPSGAFAWRITEEDFMPETEFLTDLKFRTSIGVIGNQAINPYQSLPLVGPYGQGVFNAGDRSLYYSSYQPTSFNNPDLKWETTRQLDIGLDAGFLNNRIQVTADYYWKYTYDLLLNAPIPVTSGFSETILNIGNVKNRGFDLDVRSVNTTGELKWTSAVNFSRNRNEVTDINSDTDIPLFNGIILRKGEAIGTIYGHEFEGIFQSDEEAQNSIVLEGQKQSGEDPARAGDRKYRNIVDDDVIDGQDRTIIGNALPDFTWGLTNNLSYKNFSLSFFFQGSYGNEMVNLNKQALEDFRGARNVSADAALNRWTLTNPSNKYPSARANRTADVGIFSSAFVEDASYIRLKNVTLGYDLPSSLLQRVSVKTLKVYVSATNLFTITDYTGYNPEASAHGTVTSMPGIDQGGYPLTKTYLVGLNIGF